MPDAGNIDAPNILPLLASTPSTTAETDIWRFIADIWRLYVIFAKKLRVKHTTQWIKRWWKVQTSQTSVRLWQALHAQKQTQNPPNKHKKKVRTQTKLNKPTADSVENMYAITRKKLKPDRRFTE